MKREQLCNYIEIRTFNSFRLGKKALIFNLMRKLREEELERVELPNVVSS